jgi:hypothetical protein
MEAAIEQSLNLMEAGNVKGIAAVINRAVLSGAGPQLSSNCFF